ncbi:polysaccharide lyase [Arcticibacter eurypsychrophilus]|uniref:polysaccharide lyase n=1 Tax=Arcticibacter eurypsychrophilus TaxID=1434752 RepID=UPI00084D6A2D|nr:polysaccharide lyase [Arcticibacter eurypsychrophilus]
MPYFFCLLLTFIAPALSKTEEPYKRSHILFDCDFEELDCLTMWNNQEKAFKYSILKSDSITKTGKFSVRMELNKTAPTVTCYQRAELTLKPELQAKNERWYGLSVFFSKHYIPDNQGESILQWVGSPDFDLGENFRAATISCQSRNGNLYLIVQWAKGLVNIKSDGKKEIDLGAYTPNSWNDLVFHIKSTWEEDGLIEVWKNKVLVATYKGPNCTNDKKGSYMKLGLWKDFWSLNITSQKTIFYDEIRIGDDQASYYDVAPGPPCAKSDYCISFF